MLKRVTQGFGAVLAGSALNTVGNLVLVPLFLAHWSTTVYGEWMALSAVIAYLNAADLGMNAAAGNKLLAAYAGRDWDSYRRVQASALVFYAILAATITVLCGLLVLALPIAAWLGIKSIPPTTAAAVAWILAARAMWQMPLGLIANVFRGTGNLAASQWILNGQVAASLVVTATVVSRGGNVLNVAIWSLAPSAAAGTLAWWSLNHWRPGLVPHLRDARLSELRMLVRPSFWFGLMILAIAVSVQGPVVLVSAILGGGAVALLVTTRAVAFLVRQILGMMTSALWPELTRLDADGASSALRFGHRIMVAISIALSCGFAGTLWFQGPDLIRAWTSGRIPVNDTLLRVFLVSLVLQTPWMASATFTTATSRHKQLAYCWITSAAITFITCAVLLKWIGIVAVPVSMIVGEAVACYHFVLKDTCAVVGENYPTFALKLWPSVLAIFLSSLGIGWLAGAIAIGPELARWLEVGALTLTFSFMAVSLAGLSCADRQRLAHGFHRKLKAFAGRDAILAS